MTRRKQADEIGEQLTALPEEAEASDDPAALIAAIRRERAKQKAVTTSEILSWRHEGHGTNTSGR